MDFASRKLECGGKLILLRFQDGTRLQVRYLSYKEYLIFRSLYLSNTVLDIRVDDLIANTVVQDSVFQSAEWLGEQRAGICRTIANLMMYLAGNHYDEDENILPQMLDAARQDAQTFDNTMFSTICRIFPAYQFKDLETLTFPEILRLFACAEKALLETGVIEKPFEITRQGEQQQPKKGQPVFTSDMAAWSEKAWGGMDNVADIMRHDMAQKKREAESAPDLSSRPVRETIKRYNEKVERTRQQVSSRHLSKKGKF